jgi:hypothetical protein
MRPQRFRGAHCYHWNIGRSIGGSGTAATWFGTSQRPSSPTATSTRQTEIKIMVTCKNALICLTIVVVVTEIPRVLNPQD